jgi:hypothetical protein
MVVVGGENEVAQDDGAAEWSRWNQDFIPSVEELFQPQMDLAKGSCV